MSDDRKDIPKQFLFDPETVRQLDDLMKADSTSGGQVVRELIKREWARRYVEANSLPQAVTQ